MASDEESTLARMATCVERLQAGDPSARDEIIRIAYRRLDAMVRRMLKRDDRVGTWEQPDDVLQNAAIRLWKSLEGAAPRTVDEFLGLAAIQIRRELVDLARHYYGPQGRGTNERPAVAGGDVGATSVPMFDGVETTYDPSELALWTEFHRAVEGLPSDERSLCEMLWYLGLPQEEVGQMLGVDVSTVKRRWRSVRRKLQQAIPGLGP